jgi:hypothetical protein
MSIETDEFVMAKVGIGFQFLQQNSWSVAFATNVGIFIGLCIIAESAGC